MQEASLGWVIRPVGDKAKAFVSVDQVPDMGKVVSMSIFSREYVHPLFKGVHQYLSFLLHAPIIQGGYYSRKYVKYISYHSLMH